MSAVEKSIWENFAADARHLDSALYAELALGVDGDDALKAMAARARPGQPPPNLLFAAVHYLLLRGAEHPLRSCYATLGGAVRGENVFALFLDFVFTYRDAIQHLIETRVTNTNEVGRSAILRAGFGALAREETRILNLIEIGPSAGLNMIWDRYGVCYARGGAVVEAVNPEAPLVMDCELKTEATPPTVPPRLGRCIGLERNPVDLSKVDDRDWLRALIWPDQPHRLARLDAAIGIFRKFPADIRGGDALELLPGALAEMPEAEAVCVYHTIAIYQFSAAMKAKLQDLLAHAGRPVWHLSFEFDGGNGYAVTLTHHRDGVGRSRTLALAQSHGGWIAWR